MHQTVHIFKKDVRQFWKEIALVLASTALFTAVGIRRATHPQYLEMAWSSSMLLLPVSWWLVISRVVHAEVLPGSRAFWMTRPYSWRSLLAAKTLFVFAFINVPLFTAEAIIVRKYGFSVAGLLPGLICKQAMITAAFLMPSAALAVLTTGLVQVLLSILALSVGFVIVIWWTSGLVLYSIPIPFGAFDWLRWSFCALLVAVLGLAIVLLQYRTRRTRLSVTLGLLSLFGIVLVSVHAPWLWILEVQSRLSKTRILPSQVAVRLDSAYPAHTVFLKGDLIEIDVPLELISPPNEVARIDTVVFYIKASDGRESQFSSRFPTEKSPKLQATVPRWFYEKIKDAPLKIHGRAYVTLFSRPTLTTVRPNEMQAAVPDGLCSPSSSDNGRSYFLTCTSALRSNREQKSVRMQVSVDGYTENLIPANQFQPISYSVLPADFDLDPVSRREYIANYQSPFWQADHVQSGQPELKSIEVITSAPVAHLWTNFEIMGPQLRDHAVNMLGSTQ